MFTLTLSEIDFLPKWSSKQDLAVSLHSLRRNTGFLCPFITKILLLTSLILLLMDTEILQLFCNNEPSWCSPNLYWKGVSQCFILCLCIRPLSVPFIKSTSRNLISGFSQSPRQTVQKQIKKADAFYRKYTAVHLLGLTSWAFLPEVPLRHRANSTRKGSYCEGLCSGKPSS